MTNDAFATLGIDIAANVSNLIGLGPLASTSPYLIGLEADVGADHVGRHLKERQPASQMTAWPRPGTIEQERANKTFEAL